MEQAELLHAEWDGNALRLTCRIALGAAGLTSTPDVEATLWLRQRHVDAAWSVPLEVAGEAAPEDGAAESQWLASGSLEPLTVADGDALTSGVWNASVEVQAGGSSSEVPVRTGSRTIAPAVVGNRPIDAHPRAQGSLALDVDQAERPLLDPVIERGIDSVKITGSTLTIRLPVHVTGRGPRIEVHLVPDQPRRVRHILRTFLGPDSGRPGSGLLKVKLPRLGSAKSWSVELRLDRHGAGPTSQTDIVLVRRDRSTQLIRSALHRARPTIALRSDVVARRVDDVDQFYAATWRRRLLLGARSARRV